MSNKKLNIVTFDKEEYDDYQKYHSSKEEWPNINISKDLRVTLNVPMLIMELFRLVPYKEGRYIHFHPFNMPHIKVRKIELVGIVTNIKRNANNLFLTIEDGTGVIQVNYKMEQYMSLLKQRKIINEKYRQQAADLKQSEIKVSKDHTEQFPKIRPGFSYPHDACFQDMAVLENKWWSETNNGLLGKEIQLSDYIYVSGYPTLDVKFQKIPQEITAEFIEHARLTIFAISVTCISEKTYNKKLIAWMDTICQRYIDKREKLSCKK